MHSQSVYVNSNRHTQRSFSNSCLPLISFIIKYCIFLFPRLLLDYPAVHTAHGVWQVKYSAWSAGGTTTPCNEPKLNRCRNFLAALHSHAHWMIWHVHSYFTLRTFRDYFHLVAWGKINRYVIFLRRISNFGRILQLNVLSVAESEVVLCLQ